MRSLPALLVAWVVAIVSSAASSADAARYSIEIDNQPAPFIRISGDAEGVELTVHGWSPAGMVLFSLVLGGNHSGVTAERLVLFDSVSDKIVLDERYDLAQPDALAHRIRVLRKERGIDSSAGVAGEFPLSCNGSVFHPSLKVEGGNLEGVEYALVINRESEGGRSSKRLAHLLNATSFSPLKRFLYVLSPDRSRMLVLVPYRHRVHEGDFSYDRPEIVTIGCRLDYGFVQK